MRDEFNPDANNLMRPCTFRTTPTPIGPIPPNERQQSVTFDLAVENSEYEVAPPRPTDYFAGWILLDAGLPTETRVRITDSRLFPNPDLDALDGQWRRYGAEGDFSGFSTISLEVQTHVDAQREGIRLDNVYFVGIIPEPLRAPLLALAAVAMVARRRRRA